MKKKTILFVCLGNIVRSPLAENMFRFLTEQSGVDAGYEVDSAGTGSWHIGESPDARMRSVARGHGFHYDGQARQVTREDFDRFDLVIAMDASNREDLRRIAQTSDQRNKIRLMREFDPLSGPKEGVPDPYYGGVEGFEKVFQIVKRSSEGLLDALEGGTLK